MDIAEIGFKADTKDLDKASMKLEKLKNASKGVTSGVNSIEKSVKGFGVSFNKALGIPVQTLIDQNTGVTRSFKKLAQESAAVFDQEFSKNLPRDMIPNRFNTANIAAQFQDIGVTAAMGMNPMLIALQQGTQTSAILNSMMGNGQSLAKGLAQAFGQIVNPISLVTIGVVGLVAALIQFVDWTKLAQNILYGLADAVEVVIPALFILSAGIAAVYAPAIISGIGTLISTVWAFTSSVVASGFAITTAWLAALGPGGWIALGIVGLTAALYAFRGSIKGLIGVDLFKWLDNVTSAISKALKDLAKGLDTTGKGKKSELEKEQERWEKLINTTNARIISLEAEEKAMSMTQRAAEAYRIQTELLNQAQAQGINLDRIDIGSKTSRRMRLEELAKQQADYNLEIKRSKEAFDFAKDGFSGFVDDLKSGLQEGKNLFATFADAILNIANKLTDKLLDTGIDMIFEGIKTSSGESGFLGSIAGLIGLADGGVVNKGVQPFAKGGAFTNGLYDRPTMFASGGTFGVMGEAGPEAVMPLHRGSDGSLGVRVSGSNDNDSVVVNVINNSGASTRTEQRQTGDGIELDVLIDDAVSQKIGDQGSATNRSLQLRDSRRLIRR